MIRSVRIQSTTCEDVAVLDGAACVIDDYTLLPATSLRIKVGECVAIRGANGSGKTTLLRMTAGLLKPTSGSVHVMGLLADNRSPAFRREVSALIGTPFYYSDLTIGEHYLLIATTWSIPDRERIVLALLRDLGLSELKDRFPHELSSGQKQLFSLGAALIRPSRLLLLDEPEQRLDAERRIVLAERLEDARKSEVTIIFATHDEGISQRIATRVVSLDYQEKL